MMAKRQLRCSFWDIPTLLCFLAIKYTKYEAEISLEQESLETNLWLEDQ